MKPCLHCGQEFYCQPCVDVGGSLREKRFCTNACLMAYRKRPEVVRASFWARVDKSAGQESCWVWKGAVTAKWGYGCTNYYGRVLGAHKVAWLLTNGDPGELCVLHKCDNRLCVNPAHFFLGTKQDNANDAVAKGRQAKGTMTKKTVLNEDIVREIKKRYVLYHGRKSNAKELAAEYGCTPGAIGHIARGLTWKHVK